MIYIEGNYEQVTNLDDVIRICREYINDEFADKVEEMCEEIKNRKELIYEAQRQLEEAQECIEITMFNLKEVIDEQW